MPPKRKTATRYQVSGDANGPRSLAQNSRMHALATKRSLGHEDLQAMAEEISGGRTTHTSELKFSEANEIIHRLGGHPFPERNAPVRGQSIRNQQHKRQQAGVKQLSSVSPSHLDLLRSWGLKCNLEGTSLHVFIDGQLGHDWPRTTAETSRIIQALKSMHGRGWRAGQDAAKEAA